MRYTPNLHSKWINYVKTIFDDCGRSDVWLNDGTDFSNCIRQQIKRKLLDQNYQVWHANPQNSTKGTNYQLFKYSVKLELYFLVPERKNHLSFIKFRTANHRLPVEVLRWEGVPHSERICHLCDATDVADEFSSSFMLQPFYSRKKAIYQTILL